MNNLINERNLEIAHNEGKTGNGGFNCWNATLFVLGKTDELYWSDNFEIADFINEETFTIPSPSKWDILVLYDFPSSYWAEEQGIDPEILRICHTAVYIGNGQWFHKRGESQSEFATENEIKEIYPSSSESKYRRISS